MLKLLDTEATELERSSAPVEIAPLGSLEGAAGEWRDLAERSRNIFSTWEWARMWWRVYGKESEQRLFACRSPEGRPLAILPLERSAIGPLRALRFSGHGPGDLLGPVCGEGERGQALAGLDAALRSMDDWDLFAGERMPGHWDAPSTLGARPLLEEGNPTLEIGGRSWDDILAGRSGNFRSQVRRRERKIDREFGLTFRLTSSADEVRRDMEVLFALHSARWGAEKTRFAASRRFHMSFAAEALERGWLRLWIAEAGGRPAAAWYGFRYGGVESFYQSGRDPAFDPWSIGFVLLNHSIRAAAQDGMSEYRFLRGDETYKGRFSDVDRGVVTVARGRTAAGRAAVEAAFSLRRRVRGRRLVGGLVY